MTTPRESFISALRLEPPSGRVPHFELEFFLTMEAFGRVHPAQRVYKQWGQMSEAEKRLHRLDIADLHVTVARQFNQAGMLFHPPAGWDDEDIQISMAHVREMSGMDYLITLHGDATYSLPGGEEMMDFVVALKEKPKAMKDKAQERVDKALERGAKIKKWGLLDGFCLCSDYCFNSNPFLSPTMFDDFITPYLVQLVAGYRELGFYVIKHTDGNIMPILDSLVAAKPHALHSLDPQGGVNLGKIKEMIGDQICLIGNVNCALLQTGSDEEVKADVRRSLQQGMPGGGYVFGTSNCIYTGMRLERYEFMLNIWQEEGVYQ